MKLDRANRYTFKYITFPTASSISVILLLWITIFSAVATSLPAPKSTNGTNILSAPKSTNSALSTPKSTDNILPKPKSTKSTNDNLSTSKSTKSTNDSLPTPKSKKSTNDSIPTPKSTNDTNTLPAPKSTNGTNTLPAPKSTNGTNTLPPPNFTNGTNAKQTDRLFVNDITKCPPLPPRAVPATNVRDLRADDIKVVMGLGDSVMAGFGIRVDKLDQIFKNGTDPLDEYRGANFALGGDPDVISIPNILRKFSPNLVGDSKGTHIIEVCYGILCPSNYIPKSDQLNAAQSGAQALNIDKQVNYLIDQLSQRKDIDVKNDWKLATIWFGNNDLCNGCTDIAKQIQFSPDQFESHIRDGLEKLRKNVPRVFVNLMSVFKISQMFEASLKDENCVLGKVAGLFLECQCAFVPGPLGDKSRKAMDDLADQYNERLKNITSDYQEKNFQDFIVSYDPGMENMDLSNASLDLLSGVDCFHPSLLAHERLAKAAWNNIFTQQSQKTSKYDPTVDLPVLCPNEDDRLF
ncbi:hypothetical protein RclHR1_03490006 [Rhizophagus clarus]|uniref:Phospholipase B1, membrane-associated-like n=1 Tax=Rhizophagus clarus TaxID=94130 RepID=A0A2Z6RMF0_9GLOM|nr:hypothetical protein RclHR1_03490006 [Rhizophagus clarus]GES89825.1 phospholipase B1, membrane-associated-like [Rhizophagus clarus]